MATGTIIVPPDLGALLPEGGAGPFADGEREAIPAEAGAYLLLLRLDRPLDLVRPAAARLAPGWYVYAGSARGPGGLRGRLARHLRSGKRPHWHVDQVTSAAGASAGLAYPGRSECGLVAGLVDGGGFGVPVPGFGSSDCRICESHLLRWTGSGPAS